MLECLLGLRTAHESFTYAFLVFSLSERVIFEEFPCALYQFSWVINSLLFIQSTHFLGESSMSKIS